VDEKTLKLGWWVSRTLHRDIAPLRSYVGQIQQVDERGLRITMINWLDGAASDRLVTMVLSRALTPVE